MGGELCFAAVLGILEKNKFAYSVLFTGLNLICLHSLDAIMVEGIRRGQNWERYDGGGKLYM